MSIDVQSAAIDSTSERPRLAGTTSPIAQIPHFSRRLTGLGSSVIRQMMGLNASLHGAAAIDLAGGIPEFAPPPELLDQARTAIGAGVNHYAAPPGAKLLQHAVARRLGQEWGHVVNADAEITISCGTTEGLLAVLLAITNPGDEVIIIEPAYDSYVASCRLVGAIPRIVQLRPPSWRLDIAELRMAFTEKTRALILNSPHNPTGMVCGRSELEAVGELCIRHCTVAIADEIYSHFTFADRHISLATIPGMAERTVTLRGASKMYAVTGWRVGWVVANPDLSSALRAVHELLTMGAPHPLQLGVAQALNTTPESYYDNIRSELAWRRNYLVEGLMRLGFTVIAPAGGLFVMAGIERFPFTSDVAMARYLIEHCAVSSVPGSGFYCGQAPRPGYLRFTFARRRETIERALAALARLLA